MARFQANFSIYPTAVFAPAKVSFNNISSVGRAINDDFTQVVNSDGEVVSLIGRTIDQIDVFTIDKYEWEFGDGEISIDENPDHIFQYTNLYPVKLTIYSSEFYDTILNAYLRVRNSVTKDIDIGSMSYAWLQQHMIAPHKEALETSTGFKDLITATGKMFDRMYHDIAEAVNLIDIKKVAPKFLEFFSDTLGHKRFYAQKVGFSVQDDNELQQPFLEYDIFTRISNDTASDEEIQVFRNFIIDTAKLFKENGSEQAMESFFKLYGFTVDIKEMWTTNFGTTPINEKIDNFFGRPVLENTINNFAFKDISISGLDNSKGYITSTTSNLIIDNYHYNTRHVFPSDSIIDDGNNCEAIFEINEVPPRVMGVVRDDGRDVTEKETCGSFFTTLCSTTNNEYCTETNLRIARNENWSGISKLTSGANTKIWRTRDNYVQSVINTVGLMPSGVDEAFESPSDTTDDYLWADWKTGITIAPDIPGITEGMFRKPSTQLILPSINLSTTQTSAKLISPDVTTVDTSRDTFVCMRGFIKVDITGYYNFFLDIGNTGDASDSNHIGLFSLKHQNVYSEENVYALESLDTINFPRSTSEIQYSVTDGTNTKVIYGRESEYGIVELRQNESVDDGYSTYNQDAGFYRLIPGYYAYEIKATYNTLRNKKLLLSWQIWDEVVRPSGTFFEIIQYKTQIPSFALFTFDESQKSIEDTQGKGILSVPHELLEGADSLKVVYFDTHELKNNISGFISKDGMIKNGEFTVRISPIANTVTETLLNERVPNKKFGIIFRGTHNNKDLYSNVDTYYAFIMDGRNGEYGIAHICYEPEIDDVVFRYLNLNKNSTDLDKREYTKSLVDSYNHIIELGDNVYYDFKVSVNNNIVSVSYRENSEFTTAVTKIQQSLAIDLENYNNSVDEWILLIDNIDLNQDDVQTETFDINNNIIDVPQKYMYNDKEGTYGLFVVDSMFKVNTFRVKSLDEKDFNLTTTTNRFKELKPKYLDSRSTKTLKYNSYDINDKLSNTFNVKIFDSYAGESETILPPYLGQIDDNLVNKVFASNVSASALGSRLNILFNSDYINSHFAKTENALDSICVQIGKFYEPFVEWSYVNPGFSNIPYAGYLPIIAESSRVMPHTIASLTDENGSQVLEYISEMDRDGTHSIVLNTTLNTYIKATNNVVYSGIWEEVAPHSVDEFFNVPTLGEVENEIFTIIKRDSNVIGVKIKSAAAFEKIQCRYCENATLWGLYEINLPREAVTNLPEYLMTMTINGTNNLTEEELSELEVACSGNDSPFETVCSSNPISFDTIRYFIPIGKLNTEYVVFLPPAGILENENININLIGVYGHLDMDKVISTDTVENIKFDLVKLNDFEIQYKSKVTCSYYIDVETSFIAKITKYNDTVVQKNIPGVCNPGTYLSTTQTRDSNGCANFISNAYFIPDVMVKLVEYIQSKYDIDSNNQIDSEFNEEFIWWMPSDLWLKRQFSISYPENNDSVLFTGFSDIGNTFYGQTIESAGVKLAFDDNMSIDTGDYIAESEWCVSSVGWDSDYFSVPGIFGAYQTISIGEKMGATIPLQTVSTSGDTYLTFGDYYNNETIGKRTFTPVGTFNWLQTHSDGISGSSTTGWSVSDWNDEFGKCVSIKNIFVKIPTSVYELNKYWGFFGEYIPPIASDVNITYNNRNCYSIDGDNAPEATNYSITLGVSDGYNGFYPVPPLVENYVDWITKIKSIYINNYILEPDEYFTSINTEITDVKRSQFNLKTDMFSFNRFIGSDIYLNFFVDKLFPLETSQSIKDDFVANRNINWITCFDNTQYYEIGKRDVDAELKYTSGSLPYNLKTYKNKIVYQAVDKFVNDNDDIVSGSKESISKSTNIVGFDNNRGFTNQLSIIDVQSNNYVLECDFIFDKDMKNTSYDRKFELVLKAENNYIVTSKKWGITDLYYVGVGTNGFDIGLGMRSYDQTNGIVNDTFLASFGDFNLRNIKLDTWYTIKAEVENDTIKIFFTEKGLADKLVLNYNINKKYEKLTERYLKGEYETLQALILGLEELTITYPAALSSKVSDDYTFEKFKQEFAGTLPIEGQYSGFRIFNDMTYVGEVRYKALLPKTYKWGSAYDVSGFNTILYKIVNRFKVNSNAEIRSVRSGLDGTIFIQIDDELFYYKEGNDPDIYMNKVHTFDIVHDKIIIVEKETPSDAAFGINRWEPGQHAFIWSIAPGANNYNVTTYSNLLRTIPNASGITIIRTFTNGNIVTRDIGYVSGTTGDITGSDSIITVNDEITVTIDGDRPILWPLNGTLSRYNLNVRAYQEGFTKEYPILIKDKTFYADNLKKYMTMTDKKIKNVYINDSILHLVFEDN